MKVASCSLLLFALGSSLGAQAPQWRLHPGASPTQISGSVMTYDSARDRVVRFGGGMGYFLNGGLAELDGDVWTPLAPPLPAPSGRVSHVFAYDEARAETILWGGVALGPTYSTETWRWDGAAWTQAFPVHVPPSMYEPSMCYDEARQRLVLHGQGQTWEWAGSDWLQRQPLHSPPSRFHHAMAFDSRRQRTVLFGGEIGASSQSDTWEWNGVDWVQVGSNGPGVRYPNMVFDRERARCVMLGFGLSGGVVGAEFDGQSWTPAPVPAQQLDEINLAYDRQRGRVVCYSGRNQNGGVSGQTWSFEVAGLAIAQPYGIGCGNPPLAATEDPNARPLLGATLGIDIANVPVGFAFVCVGWSNREFAGVPLPLKLAGIGMPECDLRQSLDVLSLPCTATSATTARFEAPLPTGPQFLGARLFVQPWALAPGQNAFGGILSNGIAVTLGSW